MHPDAYNAALNELAALLRTTPMTAAEVARACNICKPAAYKRIRDLQARGYQVRTYDAYPGTKPGPRPIVYGCL